MSNGGFFARDLTEYADQLDELGAGEVDKIADWTMQSAAHGVLQRIRKVWPWDTGKSWRAWQFKKLKPLKYRIFNTALNNRSAAKGGPVPYAGWVYAPGDKTRRPIAPGIVDRAIAEEEETIGDNFIRRLEKYIS